MRDISSDSIRTFVLAMFAIVTSALSAAQGVTSDTILIGQSAALSGPAQQLGLEM